MTKKILVGGLAAVMWVAGCGGSAAPEASLSDSASTFVVTSGSNTVVYSGQGLPLTEVCGVANGAEVDGPYLLWILTANKASSATITGPWDSAAMVRSGKSGTFKYVSTWYDPGTLIGTVTAAYDGDLKNAQLVISHGCPPPKNGAWCSPGFWKNATDAAWSLTGYAKTDLFNNTVVPSFYDTASAGNPTLSTVLNTPGANTFGAASGPFGLNAFNATGAFLTDNIPGYQFDPSFMQLDDSQTCPIDHSGNFKTPTP